MGDTTIEARIDPFSSVLTTRRQCIELDAVIANNWIEVLPTNHIVIYSLTFGDRAP